MPGGRQTHSYPHGTPWPLRFVGIGSLLIALAWVFLVPGHWYRAIPVVAAFVGLAYVSGRLHRRYEQTGQAIPIPRAPQTVVKFPDGLPRPMLAARLGFFVVVGMMLVFGWAPIPDQMAQHGIIGCVLALIPVAALNIGLEWHYLKTRRAIEVESPRKQ